MTSDEPQISAHGVAAVAMQDNHHPHHDTLREKDLSKDLFCCTLYLYEDQSTAH